jgi:hypothetical protein
VMVIGSGVDTVAVVSIEYDPDPLTTPVPMTVPDPSVIVMMSPGVPLPVIGVVVGFHDPVAVGDETVGAVGGVVSMVRIVPVELQFAGVAVSHEVMTRDDVTVGAGERGPHE